MGGVAVLGGCHSSCSLVPAFDLVHLSIFRTGSLYLNECGSTTAGPRVLRPHPDFRLFLATDPRHGEVSRAMRNRGIELFLLDEITGQITTAAAEPAQQMEQQLAQQQRTEAEAVLALAGLPGACLPAAMAEAHTSVAAAARAAHRAPPSLRELRRWVALARALVARGWPAVNAFRVAYEQVYDADGSDEPTSESRAAATAFQQLCLPALQACRSCRGHGSGELVLYRAGAWPLPLSAGSFATDSMFSTLGRDAAVLLQYMADLVAADGAAAASSGGNIWRRQLCRTAAVASGGLAMAASTPTSLLLGSTSDASAELEKQQQHRHACVLAAAQVYVERASPWHLPTCANFASVLLEQIRAYVQAAAGAGIEHAWAASAAAQARDLVCRLLHHPVAAALSALQQQVSDAATLRDIGVRLVPSTQTAAPPPHLAATEYSQDNASLWDRMLALSTQLAAAQCAVQAAVFMQAALAVTDAAVASDSATLLQLSSWRYLHPNERSRRPVPHASIDVIVLLLLALQALEESLLQPDASRPWTAALADKVTGGAFGCVLPIAVLPAALLQRRQLLCSLYTRRLRTCSSGAGRFCMQRTATQPAPPCPPTCLNTLSSWSLYG